MYQPFTLDIKRTVEKLWKSQLKINWIWIIHCFFFHWVLPNGHYTRITSPDVNPRFYYRALRSPDILVLSPKRIQTINARTPRSQIIHIGLVYNRHNQVNVWVSWNCQAFIWIQTWKSLKIFAPYTGQWSEPS